MDIRDIYSYDVIDEINAGKTVYVVDKFACNITSVNNLSVEEYAKIINHDNKNKRYEFYIIERE